jgi:hypothetical protein
MYLPPISSPVAARHPATTTASWIPNTQPSAAPGRSTTGSGGSRPLLTLRHRLLPKINSSWRPRILLTPSYGPVRRSHLH